MPSGQDEAGIIAVLGLGLDCSELGDGVSGVLKGWAALVDVAAGAMG